MAELIGPSNEMPFPTLATPCRASDHQLYAGMPRRGMAAAEFTSWEIFSSRVRRETRSLTRRLMERSGWQKRKVLVCGSEGSQENGDGVDPAEVRNNVRQNTAAKPWSFMVRMNKRMGM